MAVSYRRAGWRKIALALAVGLSGPALQAQETMSREQLEQKYPNQEVVCLRNEEHLSFYLDAADSLKWTTETDQEFYVFSNARAHDTKRIYFSGFRKVYNIHVYIKEPGKKNYHEVRDVNLSQSRPSVTGIFYDDTYAYDLYFPGLQDGCMLRITYSSYSSEPHFIRPFYFALGTPCMRSVFSVKRPEAVSIGYYLPAGGEDKMQYTETRDKNGTVTSSWSMNDLDEIHFEESSLSYSYYEPHVLVYVSRYTAGGEEHKVYQGLGDLYNWCNEHLKKADDTDMDEVKHLTDSILTGVSGRMQQLRTIYYWVQDNIRYVSFEDGYSGYIPRKASAVCTKRYGDCKDMANLLHAMLQYAGFDVYRCWVGTRDIPYDVDSIHLPCSFNHMISAVQYNDSLYFLDATSSFQPIGQPTDFIQTKKLLMEVSDSVYKVAYVPKTPYQRNLVADSVLLYVDQQSRTLTGKGHMDITGSPKIDLSYRLSDVDKSHSTDILSAVYQKGSNKYKLTHMDHSSLKRRDDPLTVQYDFRLEDYLRFLDDEIIMNLNLPVSYGYFYRFENRKTDVDLENTIQYVDYYKLEIPEGYELTEFPKSASWKGDDFGFTIEYNRQDNVLVRSFSIYNNRLSLPLSVLPDWNKMCGELGRIQKQNIILKKKK